MGLNVKNTTLIGISDLIAPHSCKSCGTVGKALCDNCKNYIMINHQNICPNCKAIKTTPICPKCPSLPPCFIINDRSTIIGNLIHDYKYNSIRALSYPIAEICRDILPIFVGNVSIVPLPTISRHIRERGFDHITKIARIIAHPYQNWKVEPLLIRARQTVQVGASESERLSQAKKAYQLNSKITINPDTTYILFDDVWTTGASMKAAHKILSNAGATKIVFLILAVSRTKN
ncbi:ComF family protein [Candidatus Saccharibacteria bacterium]|nr:ComF family protein [Candidatus Saccharibacteria bacterium]MBQ3476427.1 ComF family protein [Candidatus Saccharibacteria bacterium]